MEKGARTAAVVAAFAVIYLVWGSTYLAIRWAIESIPPFFMIGSRTLLAGTLLYAWARLRGDAPLTRREWAVPATTGVLLFAGGQGVLALAQKRVPSGAAALVIATVPLWMTLLEALKDGVRVLSPRVVTGLLIGFGGVAMLVEPSRLLGGRPLDPVGTALLVFGALSWSTGSIIGHDRATPRSLTLSTGASLIAGGSFLLAASLPAGEIPEILSGSAPTLRSLLSFAYLVLFGSILGFGCYAWLLRVSTPSRVSTYAFVNPVIAVIVGAVVGGEKVGARIATATLMMAGAVALILTGGVRARRAAPRDSGAGPERGSLVACGSRAEPEEA